LLGLVDARLYPTHSQGGCGLGKLLTPMKTFVAKVRTHLRQFLTDDQQLRLLQSKLTQERQRVERLREHNQRLKMRTQNSTRRGVHNPKQRKGRPPVGDVHLGDLRRLSPISRSFGLNRGRPIDRYYIENFLASHSGDVGGRVLEIKDSSYTRRYGGEHVNASDVLDIAEDNPQATIVADLTRADHVPSNAFDCIICTQTLHFIYDVRSAVQTLHRILKPGGILLVTFPGISQSSCERFGEHYCWAFTKLSALRLFEEAFPARNIEVETHGNVLAASAFLYGLAVEDLRQGELDHHDPDYELLITLRAVKPEAGL
jgi:SAM-dependent methyltransferase